MTWILKHGGEFAYDWQIPLQGTSFVKPEPPAPKWLRALVGDDYFQTVTEVWITDTAISDISALAALSDLRFANLSDNRIRDISALASHTELQQLVISNNQISDVTPLRKLTKLLNLNLSGNRIKDVTALKELINLHSLDLCNNKISDGSPLAGLSQKGTVSLELLGNPLSEHEIYTLTGDRRPFPESNQKNGNQSDRNNSR